jgi:hypothetical protein
MSHAVRYSCVWKGQKFLHLALLGLSCGGLEMVNQTLIICYTSWKGFVPCFMNWAKVGNKWHTSSSSAMLLKLVILSVYVYKSLCHKLAVLVFITWMFLHVSLAFLYQRSSHFVGPIVSTEVIIMYIQYNVHLRFLYTFLNMCWQTSLTVLTFFNKE